MQIVSSEALSIQLDPVKEYDFHEKPVALMALGSFVAASRADRELAIKTADLACRLATLSHTDDDGNKITTESFTLTEEEIRILGKALYGLMESTQDDVKACAQLGNLHGCSVRYIEGALAERMLGKLDSEVTPLPTSSDQNFQTGFARPAH